MGPGNRPLDMEWLEDFLALADTGNFSRAAEARAIAQPAFSRHIRSLEEWVGVDLVDRSAHPVELTAAGKRFHPLLKEVLSALEAARIKAHAAHDEAAASLRFAATHVLSLHFFPRWLAGLEETLRMGPVQTVSDSMQGCEELMLQRRVQFVLCYGADGSTGRLDEGGYPVARLGGDVLVPVTAPDGAGRPLHRVGDGTMLPVLAYGEGSALGRILRHRLRAVFAPGPGDQPMHPVSIVFTAVNGALLRTMALQGRGVAWLPQTLVAEDLRAGRLVDAGNGDHQVPVDIRLYRQRAEMAQVAESLWKLVSTG
ncbi:MAG: LysR family transcriptional regulator [Burkholderiales bacterium]|nr:LysR family transcriptional regulator [Burkholderiales bacterium]